MDFRIVVVSCASTYIYRVFFMENLPRILDSGYYVELLQKEICIRKTQKISKDKILSIFLILLKAPAFIMDFILKDTVLGVAHTKTGSRRDYSLHAKS